MHLSNAMSIPSKNRSWDYLARRWFQSKGALPPSPTHYLPPHTHTQTHTNTDTDTHTHTAEHPLRRPPSPTHLPTHTHTHTHTHTLWNILWGGPLALQTHMHTHTAEHPLRRRSSSESWVTLVSSSCVPVWTVPACSHRSGGRDDHIRACGHRAQHRAWHRTCAPWIWGKVKAAVKPTDGMS